MNDIPQDIPSEAIVLGAAVVYAPDAMIRAKDVVSGGDFYRPAHAELWVLLDRMLTDGKPIELASVVAELRADASLAKRIGGYDYVVELAGSVPSDANVEYYARRVRTAADKRRTIQTCDVLSREIRSPDADAGELVSRAMAELAGVGERQGGGQCVSLIDAADSAIQRADEIAAGKRLPGLATGFKYIDGATGLMQRGDLWTLGAGTSVGKSAFAHCVAAQVAAKNKGVLIVSAEMSAQSVAARLLASRSGIHAARMRGQLHEEEYAQRAAAREEFRRWKLHIMDRAATVPEVSVWAKMLAAKSQKPALIILDYLQLLTPVSGDTRAQQISGIAWSAKRMAMELDCVVMLLSQLNRTAFSNDNPPSIHALKESGDIENHSNVVLLLHRPSPAPRNGDLLGIYAKVAKARDGHTTAWPEGPGTQTCWFDPEITRFYTDKELSDERA